MLSLLLGLVLWKRFDLALAPLFYVTEVPNLFLIPKFHAHIWVKRVEELNDYLRIQKKKMHWIFIAEKSIALNMRPLTCYFSLFGRCLGRSIWEAQSHCLRPEELTVHPDELCCCQRPLVALLELLSLLLCCGLLHTTDREATSRCSSTATEEEEEEEDDMGHWAHCCRSRGRLTSLPLLPVSCQLMPASFHCIMYIHMRWELFWHANNLDWCSFARTSHGRTRRHLMLRFPL